MPFMKSRIFKLMTDQALQEAQASLFYCVEGYIKERDNQCLLTSLRIADNFANEVAYRKRRTHKYNLALLEAIELSKKAHKGKSIYNFCYVNTELSE